MKRFLIILSAVCCFSCIRQEYGQKQYFMCQSRDPRLTGSWRSVLYDFDILKIESDLPTTSFGYYFTKDSVLYIYDTPWVKAVRYKVDGDTLWLSGEIKNKLDEISPEIVRVQKFDYKFIKIKQ